MSAVTLAVAVQSFAASSDQPGLRPSTRMEEGHALLQARTYRLSMDRFLSVKEGSAELSEKSRALAMVAEARLMNREYSEAYEAYRSSLRMSPLSLSAADLEFRSAVALVYLKRYKTALYELERFESRHPRHPLLPDVKFWKGEAYFQLENYPVARAEYMTLLEGAPRYSHKDLAAYLSAWCSFKLEDYPAALRGFQDVQEGTKDHDLAKLAAFQVAETRFRRGEYSKSCDAYETFLKEHPGDVLEPVARYGLGWAAEKDGKPRKAEEQYGHILVHSSTHPLAPWSDL